MKIFMLIKWLHYSGAPKMFAWVANSLADKGHDVTVFTFMECEKGVALSPNIRHIHKNLENVGLIGKIRNIRAAIKEIDPDVSISFLLDANVYNMFACYGLRTKSVVCERNDPFKPGYYKLKFWKPWFRLADGAVYQLPKVAKYYSNIKGKTAVIPNPVLCKSDIVVRPFAERKKEIVTLGRIDLFQKRHDVLVKAFAIFHKSHPDYTLVIYGDGDKKDTDALKALIEELGVSHAVNLAGVTHNPQESIKDSALFALSSDFEGIPNALIEAMSIGLPCISTDCRPGGAAFLIENGVNGYVVPAGDTEQFAERMSAMVTDPGLMDVMSKESLKISERLSEGRIADMWNEYVESLVAE